MAKHRTYGDEELKAIFKQLDTDKSGTISEAELTDGIRALGVKITQNSARRLSQDIVKDGNGGIGWKQFREFFCRADDSSEVKAMLSHENQRFFEYKLMVDTNPQFAKTFKVPPLHKPTATFGHHNDSIVRVAWLSDSKFASGSVDGDVHVWRIPHENASKPTPLQTLACTGGLFCMDSTIDGSHLLCGLGSKSRSLWLWDLANHRTVAPTMKYDGHNSPVYSCKFGSASGSASSAVAGLRNGHIVQHDLLNAEPLLEFKGHDGLVQSCDLKNAGHILLTASSDGHVKLFDLRASETGSAAMPSLLIEDAATSGIVYQALFRGEHETVTCGDDYCIKRWDLRQLGGELKSSYFGHTSAVRSIALSSRGEFIVSAAEDGSLRVWLADELGMIAEAEAQEKCGLAALQGRMDSLESEFLAGTCTPEDWKEATNQAKEAEERVAEFQMMRQQREELACTQSCLALDGHKAPAVTVAWREPRSGRSRIISGARDEKVCLFEVEASQLSKLDVWRDPELADQR